MLKYKVQNKIIVAIGKPTLILVTFLGVVDGSVKDI